jgi:metal-responsive CopG/Arc/MetJ family transcriptional regulator
MTHESRKRIMREATPEERDRHRLIREQIKEELPELKQWARSAAARHEERVAVGTVLTGHETKIAEAIDNYATEHSLTGRSAVVREALAQLLGIELARK